MTNIRVLLALIFAANLAGLTGNAASITGVTILTNGVQAAITISGLSTNGTYAYGLGTNNTPELGDPRFILSASAPGYTNDAAAISVNRLIYGTGRARLPWPSDAIADETYSNGAVTIKIWLSEDVYYGDTNLQVTLLSGLYTQGGTPSPAVTNLAVINNSVLTYPKAAAAWGQANYQVITNDQVWLSVLVEHGHANYGNIVGSVKITGTDGTVTNSIYVNRSSVNFDTGDAEPVEEYAAWFPTDNFTGTSVTFNFEVFPNIGDSASRVYSGDGVNTGNTPNYAPQTWANDRLGTYGSMVARVAAGGSDTLGQVISRSSYDPENPPTAYATIAKAAASIAATNNLVYGRNDVGNGYIYLDSGSHVFTGGSQTYGTTPTAWITIMPAPGVSRDSCIISSASGNLDISDRVHLYQLKITSTIATFNGVGALWLDECEIDSASGTPFGLINVWYVTRNLWTRSAQGIRGSGLINTAPALVRGNRIVQLASGSAGMCHIYTFVGNYSTHSAFTAVNKIAGQTAPIAQMPIFANNRILQINNAGGDTISWLKDPAIIASAVSQNIFEKSFSNTGALGFFFAESGDNYNARWLVIDGNAFLGERTGLFYNWETSWGQITSIFVRNNIFSVWGSKTDVTVPQASTNIYNWAVHNGVNFSGNIDAAFTNMSAAGSLHNEFYGLNSIQAGINPVNYLLFKNRQFTDATTNTIGIGDYRVATNSPAVGLPRRWSRRFDIEGTPRLANDPTGPHSASSYYHVAMTGNDTNNGSYATPWRTIQKAVNTLLPGESVWIRPGDYNENVVTVRSGTQGYPITIRSDRRAILQSIRVNQHQWIVLDGLTFRGMLAAFGSDPIPSYVRVENNSHNGVVTNCVFGPGLYANEFGMVWDSTSQTVSNAAVNWAARGFKVGGKVYGGSSSLTNWIYANHGLPWTITSISNNVMGLSGNWVTETNTAPTWSPVHAGQSYQGVEGIRFIPASSYAATNWQISGCLFTNLWGAAFNIQRTRDVMVSNNVVRGVNGYKLILLAGTNTTLVNNLVLDCTNHVYYSKAQRESFFHPEGGSTWYDHQIGFIHNEGAGPTVNALVLNNWFENVYNPLGQLDSTPESSGLTFQGNVFIGVGAPLSGGLHNMTLKNNTFFRCGYDEGYSAVLNLGSSGINVLSVVSNVFVDIGDHGTTNSPIYTLVNVTNAVADYNFIANAETIGYQGYAVITETNGLKGGSPLFQNQAVPRGPDGLPFTEDDGLRPLPTAPYALRNWGALAPVTVQANIPLPHFRVTSTSAWQDATGTNYNPAWHASDFYLRTNVLRPYWTGEAVGKVPVSVSLTATGSISGTFSSTHWHGIKEFHWDFGDGSKAVTHRPVIDHTYLWPGEFTISLGVMNTASNLVTVSKPYKVLEPSPAWTNTVRFVSLTGNDSNAGTYAEPWRTISKGWNTANPGDYVAVLAGNYNELSDINRNVATTNNRIELHGFGATNQTFQIRHPNWGITGFAITGRTNDPYTGVYVYQYAHNTRIRHCRFQDFGFGIKGAIFVNASGDPDAGNGTFNGVIEWCTFTNISTIQIINNNGSNWVYRSNRSMNSTGEGDFIRPNGVDHWIEYNWLYWLDNGDSGGHTDIIQLVSQVEFNRWFRNIYLRFNYFEGNPNSVDDMAMGQLESGHFADPRWTNFVVEFNVFNKVRGPLSDSIDGLKIRHNTFYQTPRVSGNITTGGGERGSSYGTQIYNNIFFGAGVGDLATSGWYYNAASQAQSSNTTVYADHNFVAGLSGSAKSAAPPYDSYLRWGATNLAGQTEINGVNGGFPGFVNATAGDFRLLESALVKGIGTNVGATVDFLGRPINSPPDLGAISFYDENQEAPPDPPVISGGQRIRAYIGRLKRIIVRSP